MKNVVIVSGARTPIGRYGGTLRDVPVYKFTSLVLNEVIKRATIGPSLVDDVIMGQSYQNGECATGAMRLVTLLHEMKRSGSRFGLETICGGGGLGIAAVVERGGF